MPEQRARIEQNREAAFEKALLRAVRAAETAYLEKNKGDEALPVWMLAAVE